MLTHALVHATNRVFIGMPMFGQKEKHGSPCCLHDWPSSQVVESLRLELVSHMQYIRKLIDNIALLDMLLSFAEVASTSSAAGRVSIYPYRKYCAKVSLS